MWIFSASRRRDFGCRNAPTRPDSIPFYRKRTFAGLFSTRTDCFLEIRSRSAPFTRRVTHLRVRPHSHAIEIPAGKSGAPRKVIRDDPAYREFYRDVGFDLPLEHLGPVARGVRKFSGIKYHRVTGGKKNKELYQRTAAEKAADADAAHFLEQRRAQFRELADSNFDPIVVTPFDAELFGHWWFEGPRFLETFIRSVASDQSDFRLTTPSVYLATNPTQQTIEPAESSWGDKGYLEVWIDKNNSWIYPHLHACAQRMHKLATANQNNSSEQTDRLLKQLARELLLAQSSDWAFLMRTGTAREYATKRTLDHVACFNQLHDQFVAGAVDETFLAQCERRDNLFPNLNWRYYA